MVVSNEVGGRDAVKRGLSRSCVTRHTTALGSVTTSPPPTSIMISTSICADFPLSRCNTRNVAAFRTINNSKLNPKLNSLCLYHEDQRDPISRICGVFAKISALLPDSTVRNVHYAILLLREYSHLSRNICPCWLHITMRVCTPCKGIFKPLHGSGTSSRLMRRFQVFVRCPRMRSLYGVGLESAGMGDPGGSPGRFRRLPPTNPFAAICGMRSFQSRRQGPDSTYPRLSFVALPCPSYSGQRELMHIISAYTHPWGDDMALV